MENTFWLQLNSEGWPIGYIQEPVSFQDAPRELDFIKYFYSQDPQGAKKYLKYGMDK